jgi:hypothetical protein
MQSPDWLMQCNPKTLHRVTTTQSQVMNTADTIAEREQYSWGFFLVDDDEPRVPEPDPMSSAQSRRAWRTPNPGQWGLPAIA